MSHEPTVVYSEPAGRSTTHVVHAAMQFLVAVRYRKSVVLKCLAVAALLGGFYFATATRYYGAEASVLVLGSGSDGTSFPATSEGTRQQGLMATFESLFTSAKVVQGAFPYLRSEDRIDLAGVPQVTWVDTIQRNLYAQVVRGTNIIQISYRSKNPRAAVSVVNAVVQSYVDFLDRTHKGTADEVIRVLTREKTELAERLAFKEQELLQARYAIGDLGIRSDGQVTHPVVQRALYFNEQLIQTQKQRVELEASLAAIQASVRNGEDLQQHIMTVANMVGMEMMLRSLGINSRDSYVVAEMERSLLNDRALLTTMREHFGPAHPEVVEKLERIRMTEQYLMGYQQRFNERLAEVQSTQLGPLLVQMVQQKLAETWQLEAALQARFQQTQAEAISLNSQMVQLEIIDHDLKWLRSLHDALLDKIASLDLKQEGQEVRTAVVKEPVEMTSPVSPRLSRVILMILAGGLGAGMGLVYVLDILDDRFRSVEEMQSQLAVPVLAVVRPLRTPESSGSGALQVHVAPTDPESEAFRTLRTGLALADREARQIVISSAEPGDGKTTVLANLAVSYAQAEKRTLLIDADLRRPGLTALMEMRGLEGLSSIIRGTARVAEIAAAHIRPSGIGGLDVLPSGPRPPNPAELLAHVRFSELLAWAETVYDQILIDSPPALVTSDTAVIGRLVDGAVIVVQPAKNRRRMVIRAAESLTALKIPLLGLVVNRVHAEGDRGYYGYGEGYGYGYGYGYSYAHEDGDSESQPGPCDASPGADEEADALRCGIVPRRAA